MSRAERSQDSRGEWLFRGQAFISPLVLGILVWSRIQRFRSRGHLMEDTVGASLFSGCLVPLGEPSLIHTFLSAVCLKDRACGIACGSPTRFTWVSMEVR